MRQIIRLVVILLTACSIIGLVISDECTFDYGTAVLPSRYLSCVNKVKIQKSTYYTKILDSIENVYGMYVYKDLKQGQNATVSLKTLRAIVTANNLTSDLEFHSTIEQKFIQQLRDPHTVYTKPSCYNNFLQLYPFTISSKLNGNKQEFIFTRLAPQYRYLEQAYQQVYPGLLETYFGSTIQTANGVSAEDFIQAETDRIGYIDESTRFNRIAFSTDFFLREQITLDSLALVLNNGITQSTVTIEPAIFVQHTTLNVSNAIDVMQALCSTIVVEKKKKSRSLSIRNLQQQETTTAQNNVLNQDLVSRLDGAIRFHTITQVQNDTVGILELTTFEYEDLKQYQAGIREAISRAKNESINHLVLDLRSNNGGDICLSLAVARYLVPHLPYVTLPPADFRTSTLGKEFFTCPKKKYELYYEKTRKSSLRDELRGYTKWFTGPKRERGGITSTYSDLVFWTCNHADIGVSPLFLDSVSLTVLTDGSCGGACGMLVKFLQLTKSAKVVTFGGLYSKKLTASTIDMEVASYHGSAAVTLKDLLHHWNDNSCLNTKHMPKKFPADMSFSVAVMEFYPWTQVGAYERGLVNTTTPLEFIQQPADTHLWLWSSDNAEVYDSVASTVDTCVEWQVKEDSTCNPQVGAVLRGVYGRKCNVNTGKFDSNECSLFRCETGFYLKNNECLQYNFKPIPKPKRNKKRAAVLITLFSVTFAILVVIGVLAVLGGLKRQKPVSNSGLQTSLNQSQNDLSLNP